MSEQERPLPVWMPTPDELDTLEGRLSDLLPLSISKSLTLVRAVRWFMEERENR